MSAEAPGDAGREVPSRNAPCPCGSGLRYKACHGRDGATARDDPAFAEALARASEAFTSRRFAEACVHARDALAIRPADPEASLLLGMGEFQRGHAIAGAIAMTPAVPAVRAGRATEAIARPFWQQYGYVLGEAAARIGTRRSVATGDRPGAVGAIDDDTRITVAVLVAPRTSRWRAAIDSLRAQTRAPHEVLVLDLGEDDRAEIDAALASLRCPARRVACHGDDSATAIDRAFGLAGGDAVALLDGDHAYGPGHLAALVSAALASGRGWAFGRVEVVDETGRPAAVGDPVAALAADAAADVDQADTTGSAFIGGRSPLVVDTNLVVTRALHRAAGGCAGRGPLWAWSFALDLVLVAEPAFAPRASYRVPAVSQAVAAVDPSTAESATVALFRSYYLRACGDGEIVNPVAPTPRTMGDAFFRRPLQSGHVLLFDPAVIDRIAARVGAWPAVHRTGRKPGVTWVGYAFGEFGLGESMRSLALACEGAALPFDVRDVGMRLDTRQADASMMPHLAEGMTRRFTAFCVNPDKLPEVDELVDFARTGGGRVAGFWFWELDRAPDAWRRSIERVDEVWVATSFVAQAFRAVTDKPIAVVPTPVEVRRSRRYSRAEFGVPDDRFCFLFSFDFHGHANRKNAEALVDAFRAAFPPSRRDVALVIKSTNAARYPARREAIVARTGGDDRVLLLDAFLSRDAVWGLQSVCDAYVSLHRSEGLGLGLAESMAQGKPAIATAWSGNLDFMTPQNSGLVDYSLVPVAPGDYLSVDPGQHWAEPDVGHAASLMRRMADDRAWREALALRGQRDVRERLSPVRAAELIRARLAALGAL